MFEQISRDQMAVRFAGAQAGTAPLTWGQKAIMQDMRDNRDQFSMWGAVDLPDGSTVADVAGMLSRLMVRHDALRTRLCDGPGNHPSQQMAGSGEIGLDIWTIPDNADRVDVARYMEHLLRTWPTAPFDFRLDWPLRMAVIRQRGRCSHLVWVLSHLVADGTTNMLLFLDLRAGVADSVTGSPRPPQLLGLAASEQEPRLRQISSRAMPYWESQLRRIPALTFGEPVNRPGHAGHRFWRVRLRSSAAHLAILAIARRTGTDVSRVALAVVATAIGRATGMSTLTVNVMVNNRFRPGLADVFAPISQNSVVTIDLADTAIEKVVAQARGATLIAGMRAYYDPDDLTALIARLDAERGYPARVSCRFNDQRSVAKLAEQDGPLGEVSPEQVRRKLTETSLAWEFPLDHLHDQVSIIIMPRTDLLSLICRCDLWCLSKEQVEALLRAVEEVAVEAVS